MIVVDVVDSQVVVSEGDVSFQVCFKILVGYIQPGISIPVEQTIERRNDGFMYNYRNTVPVQRGYLVNAIRYWRKIV